ncbi:PAS domain-containing protein [Chitinophaga sp. SYP-B3965]|uniref:chemotaxis protein CheB n=1 Tax=Chitinophaga sp. SYP-B3965 TaxID=2663120 RepID=UPI0012997F0E|nr:chemotaxis protein CheB [Chitinophaga sp. SYP-B3965]MRG49120.1 PAS domain-containing protein [Chitinophaga sp. SYP-B3965]
MTTNKTLIKSSNLFPVVGIGASAGGLDAFKRLLKAIPEKSGIAYVLVQHLDPSHESMLSALLQKVTNIPVLEIKDDVIVEPDHIYIIPSNKMLLANDGVLELSPRPPKSNNERYLPIDIFFASLAEVHQSHAIGVVLSGTASDGTLGLKAIKDHGGITFAQDETSAAYDGMPSSAIQAGAVDFILTPENIPQKLLEITQHINKSGTEEQSDEEVFKQILLLLRIRKGTDFTYYKQTTIRRRILRRMVLNKNEVPSAYLKHIREHANELDVLFQDLLIPVTSFFRDPKTFDNLYDSVFPVILKNKISGEPIRIWVAGCSTGEEAYSFAICIKEFLGDNLEKVQIFATDLSERAITKARAGIYTKNEVEGLTPHHLERYFTKTLGGYLINKEERDMCVFAVHNFLKDPPFGKIDLISCRNVLIYMEPYLQKKALTTFHYALNAKGYMLLGKSETSSSVPDLFTFVGKNDKLFIRKGVTGQFVQVATQPREPAAGHTGNTPMIVNTRTDFQKTADDILLSKYTPASVVINEAMDILHFRGSTSNYLEQSPGKPSHNLLKMAKSGLGFELRNILHKVKKEKAAVIKENIPVQGVDGLRIINIEAILLPNLVEPHYLILFHENSLKANSPFNSKIKKEDKDLLIQQLEKELGQTRDDMRTISEDQEAVNEALQSANEELLSSSEELQSLNEELETSKEELQSTIEELTVVNQAMVGLNDMLTIEKNYAEAIVATIREPLVVLDQNLRVSTANRSFYKKFLLNDLNTKGVSIYELGNGQWDIPALRTLLEAILPEKESFFDFEVAYDFSSTEQRTLLLNAHEILKENGTEKLILLAIEDITERKKTEDDLEAAIANSTKELRHANEELQQKNQESILSKYNKLFLTAFSEKFSPYKIHLEFFNSVALYIADLTHLDYVFVGKYEQNDQEELYMHTIALASFGKLAGNIHYPLPSGSFEQEIRGSHAFPLKFAIEGYIGYPLFDTQGNEHGVIAVMHGKKIEDTETVSSILKVVARRAEIELERIKNENRLAQHNTILLKKNEELQNMNKELESFTYVSSHDLQEPLRKIQTFTTRLMEKEDANLSENGKDYFQRIRNAANRMQTLIQDLLAYSRTNVTEQKFERADLNIVLKIVLEQLKDVILEKNAIIIADELCEADIIPYQFQQLLHNLIGNALKFAQPDIPPRITITSEIGHGSKFQHETLLPKKKYCCITITDNGIGFDPTYSTKIFELFQRLHGKGDYPGTGIGLAIVKKIVENHNGIITASGTLNVGAVFTIYIPDQDIQALQEGVSVVHFHPE